MSAKLTNEEMAKEREKELAILRASNEMYEHTKQQVALNPKNKPQETIQKTLSLIENMQGDVQEQFISNGGQKDDLEKTNNDYLINGYSSLSEISESLSRNKTESSDTPELLDDKEVSSVNDILPNYDSNSSYDVIPLPSKGECYKNKLERMQVYYLTAADENLITSPNLYQDGLIIDVLLKQKIVNKNINPEDLLPGDRDAIILWLRASGYGTEFPVTVNDPNFETEFDSVVDLSKLKFKAFNLKGDENGWFDFELPISKDKIKFKFLSYKEEKTLTKLQDLENSKLKKEKINLIETQLKELLSSDTSIDKKLKGQLIQSLAPLNTWKNSIKNENSLTYTHQVTNRLKLSIMSINGNTDKVYISNYINKMNVKDSFSLRKFMSDNQPGIDFMVNISKPESLGGGSIEKFLHIDDMLFLNIAD